jgi:Relaxase/Mobilisation nuclease domain
LTKRVVRLPSDGSGLFEIVSYGHSGPKPPGRFSRAEIDQIARTVRHIPEVMVKVTGGGTKGGTVAAHFHYISRRGELEIETDEGERIGRRDEQKRLLDDWHLELTASQYRRQIAGVPPPRPAKLVHNIVLSMPAPTPPDKVLSAARKFARDKFASHRYVMALHTDQGHPHVHLVVKAESESGRRLHIDKQLLRDWREAFAHMMRDQGIAANASPRIIRGRNTRGRSDGIFKAQRYGKSTAMRERVTGIAKELSRSGTVAGPARDSLLKTRQSLLSAWMKAADVLDAQGEVILAGDVRYFAKHLPPVLTDRQRLAAQFIVLAEKRREMERAGLQRGGPPDRERSL